MPPDSTVSSSLSGKSWWGGAWSHKSVRKEEHKSEDDEATSELDVEEMLRRQMDADVRGDPGDGVLESEQGAGVLDVSAAAEAETEPERGDSGAGEGARAVQFAEQNLNLALNRDTAGAEEPAQLAGETEPGPAARHAAARMKGQTAPDSPPAAATALFPAAGKAPAAIFPKLSTEPSSAQTSTNLTFWMLKASQSLFLSTRRKTCRVLSWSSPSWWRG